MKRILVGSFIVICFISISCNPNKRKALITGELRQWHKVTLTVNGPFSKESDSIINPFLDYRMSVRFTHESGSPSYLIPGYFAADGDAANSSADSGNKWRAHLSPDKAGFWSYEVTIVAGKNIAIDNEMAGKTSPAIQSKGRINIQPTNKTGRDFRGKGRLQYVGERYLQFAGTKEYFLKAGADSPENFLAYSDFDGTYSNKEAGVQRENEAATATLKSWQPHITDWRDADPVWQGSKGKGMIGALNYLAGKGCNAFSFITYNAGGDGDDVWPYVKRDDKFHFDCSKLDQWQIVFDHAQKLGLYLHFKLQETENDDNTSGNKELVATALDGGETGIERALYLREIIARFGYELALNWNLGEENTQTSDQQKAMANYISEIDPYHHHIVIHTYPDWQDKVYLPLLGNNSKLTGISLQNSWSTAHKRILYWISEAEKSGKSWIVSHDEQNPHFTGVPPDKDFEGFKGIAYPEGTPPYTTDDIRKYTLWGVLMAGGAGVEYYFGYTLPQNDLNCQNWRSRENSWDYCRYALNFFKENRIPFWNMKNADELVNNPDNGNSVYCFARVREIYIVYLPAGGTAQLDLSNSNSIFNVDWYNPREGGQLLKGDIKVISGTGMVSIGHAPSDRDKDWVVLVRKQDSSLL